MAFINSSYLVIGAYSGIGHAVCKSLIQNGASVLLAGKDTGKLENVASFLESPFFLLMPPISPRWIPWLSLQLIPWERLMAS